MDEKDRKEINKRMAHLQYSIKAIENELTDLRRIWRECTEEDEEIEAEKEEED